MSARTDDLDRLPTGIPGLDAVLCGGLWRGSLYLLQGLPGTGKTILANQICLNQAREGRHAIYLSMLAESFTIMLAHLRRLEFFDAQRAGESIRYLSGANALEDGGFTGVLALVRAEMLREAADLVVLDTLVPLQDATPNDLLFKRRLLDLQALGTLAGFVTLLLTNDMRDGRAAVMQQMADGVVELVDEAHGLRSERSLHVSKLRGSASLRGRHAFAIGSDGIEVFPRLESLARAYESASSAPQRVSTGIEALDAMLHGGLPGSTVTGVMGGPGAGKTTLGFQFVARSTPDEPGLIFGFFEPPEALRGTSATLGVDLRRLEETGAMRVVWHPQGENLLDELAQRLLAEVDAIGAKRVVLDGYEGFVAAATHPERLTRFMTALSLELRRRETTTLITTEREPIVGLEVKRPIEGSSPVFDNLLVLRSVEQQGRLVRLLSIAKARGSAFDPAIYTFEIGDRGIAIGAPWRPPREHTAHGG